MNATHLVFTALPAIPLVQEGDDLAALIGDSLRNAALELIDDDILVIAQKIVSKAEGRFVDPASVTPSQHANELATIVRKDPRHIEVILSESTEVVRAAEGVLIVAHRLGFVMANAGVDQSNVGDDRLLLLPRDPDATAARLKRELGARYSADIGIIINDSFGRPWRNGTVGIAIGAAGVPSLKSLVGEPDLYGRALRVTEVALADELAAAASLLMGQSSEGLPVVHVRGFKPSGEHNKAAALARDKTKDLFR
ncbi:MAG: coenzyme F420-0:L-glutamate ligase [Beijerinckiaceae bacterium]